MVYTGMKREKQDMSDVIFLLLYAFCFFSRLLYYTCLARIYDDQ